MELQINIEELRKNKIFIATPMYGGMNHGLFLKSCLDLQALLLQFGVECRYSFLFNESLITRARNYLVDEFLSRTDFTHLLFLDADIRFEPMDVVAMLALDKEIIGGPYSKKSINWNNIKRAILKNAAQRAENPEVPDIDAGVLETLVGEYVFNPVPGTMNFSVIEPLEVLEIGTGYMLIKREVFEKFREWYPHLKYKPDHMGQANFDGSRYIHAFFDTVIDPDTHRYLSEDYMFCQYWRNIGGRVFLCPWMRTSHIGTYEFKGDLPKIAQLTGEL